MVSEVGYSSTSFTGRKTVVEERLLREVLGFVASSYCEVYLMVSYLSTNLDVIAVKITATYMFFLILQELY